ncbi:MAG: LysR substrate-binding domain-containing protein [Woeseiaceae bacterium]|nr:LysR substrate-binding domain-containing protein [Woeseiaceae bacterium]
MRLRQIEVFHAIYTSGTMTNAARLLNVSQPSVSKVLAHAEQQLGYPLFERVRGKLVPTPEADRLFGLVSNVYDHVEQLRHVADNLRASDHGKVRVAATPAFGVDLLPAAIASYLADHGDTVFEVETLHHDEIGAALLESRIDIGLAFDSVTVPGLTSETLAKGEFVVIAPPDLELGADDRVTLDALADQPFIGLSARGPLGRLLSAYLDNSGVEFRQVVYTETYHVAKALVARGSGISIVDTITANSGHSADVRRWKLEPPLPYSIDVISADSMPPSLLCRRFIAHLADIVADYV